MAITIKEWELIPLEYIFPNKWNPNKVANTELKLLELSIIKSGFCFPIVVIKETDTKYTIVDGYHRHLIAKKQNMKQVPCVILDEPITELMSATIRFNRARGTHQIQEMSNIVLDLIKRGVSTVDIMTNLGMQAEEVLKLKQKSGLKEAFNNHIFSKSWEEFISKNQ